MEWHSRAQQVVLGALEFVLRSVRASKRQTNAVGSMPWGLYALSALRRTFLRMTSMKSFSTFLPWSNWVIRAFTINGTGADVRGRLDGMPQPTCDDKPSRTESRKAEFWDQVRLARLSLKKVGSAEPPL